MAVLKWQLSIFSQKPIKPMQDFLNPIAPEEIFNPEKLLRTHIGRNIEFHTPDSFPDLEDIDLAIIGVPEERGAINNKGCSGAPAAVRKHLYHLDKNYFPLRLVDLGNIKSGASLSDTYAALGQTVSELLQKKITPIIIGGSHDLSYGQYLGYAKNDQVINMTVVDQSIDIYKQKEEIDAHSFLYRIFTETPNYLFNFSQLGYQSYFVSPEDIATLEKLYFEFYRLGVVRKDLEEVEAIIRDADMMSFDISALKQADAPGIQQPSPHGFFGEEGCQIARYAGITDKLSSIGFYELNPEYDDRGQSAQLVAHMIWYFLEGYYSRTGEYPISREDDFLKYIVKQEQSDLEITFLKSKRSGRWWMQVPIAEESRYERHQLIPCTYNDYQLACKDEIPERWMRAFEKLS